MTSLFCTTIILSIMVSMLRSTRLIKAILVVLISGTLLTSGVSCAQSHEPDNQMNVDIQLIRSGSHLQVINHNNFSLNKIRFELTANISDSPFIWLDPQLFPRYTRNYDLFNFENSDGEGFNYKEMEILGISMYAETVKGKILTAEWDFDNTSNDFVIPTN